MADRIAVLHEGICQQIGTPYEILHQPATPFVERFLSRQRRMGATVAELPETP